MTTQQRICRPGHELELLAVGAPWPFFVALAAAAGALLCVLLMPFGEAPTHEAPRLGESGAREKLFGVALTLTSALFGIGLLSRVPPEAKRTEPAVHALFERAWEPAGRGAQK